MRRTFAITLLIFSSFIAFSQSFKGGIMAGLSASQVDGDTYSGFNRAGLLVGGYVGHDLSAKVSWQLEMKYIQKGSHKRQNSDAGDFTTYKLRLNYVELPFTINFKYKPKIILDAGLGLGYLANTKEENQNGPYPESLLIPFHKFEVTYQLGGYYQFNKRLALNIRFEYSLLPIRTNIVGERWILFQKGQFNNVICFSLFYQLSKADE